MKNTIKTIANYSIALGAGLVVTGFGLWVITLAGNFNGF